MTRKLNKKTSELQGTFIAGFGGQKPQRYNDVKSGLAPPRHQATKPKKRKEPLW